MWICTKCGKRYKTLDEVDECCKKNKTKKRKKLK